MIISVLLWYLVISLLGWAIFPLVYVLFPALSDRGLSLAKICGLLLWGSLFWLMATLKFGQNDAGGLILAFLPLGGLSLWIWIKRKVEISSWLRTNIRLVIAGEAVFLVAFSLMCLLRAANPEILGTEKPMELAFINSILRSPTFPPNDPWLSGNSISYYYFGYVLTAMLAKTTQIPGSIAFNLMEALVFGLSAIASYGIIHNLLAALQKHENKEFTPGLIGLPLLGPIFLLINSNIEGFLEILHAKGIFWKTASDGTLISSFWKWLDIVDLNRAPILPTSWLPDRYLWWWRASRVVQDLTLNNAPQELIDEFPFFSFLLGDLHPHVIAIPFGLLAIGVALNLTLGGWQGKTRIFRKNFPLHWMGLVFPMFLLGGLAFLNTWDILIGVTLLCGAFLLYRIELDGWSWKRVEETLGYALMTGGGGFVLFLPFFLTFKSQAGGILPNIVNPTRGAQLWVMFATLLIPIIAYLIYLLFKRKPGKDLLRGFLFTLSMVFVMWVISWLGSLLVYYLKPDLAAQFMQSQGIPDLASLFRQTIQRRLIYSGGLITQAGVICLALALLVGVIRKRTIREGESEERIDPMPFVTMLVLLGGILVIAPDFVFLRDQFGWRINTIFKFYYQAWILWSLVAAMGSAVLILKLRGWLGLGWKVALVVLISIGIAYPLLGITTKTNNFKPYYGWSLDGAGYLKRDNPGEAQAIEWLSSAPMGVVSEAVGGSYSNYARVSTLSGLPTVLGWPGHESQWRGGYQAQGERQADIKELYETSNWRTAEEIINKYNIRYIYIGSLERSTYQVNESKFKNVLPPVFDNKGVVIYGVN